MSTVHVPETLRRKFLSKVCEAPQTLSLQDKQLKDQEENLESPNNMSVVSPYKHRALLACLGSIYYLTALPQNSFTVNHPAQNWKAEERRKRDKT